MTQRQKTYEDYPSPETVDSSSACDVHGPSPNSSFGSPAQRDKAERERQRGRGDGDGDADTDTDHNTTNISTCTETEKSQVSRVVELVRARAYGDRLNNEPADWIELDITPPQYRKFLQNLEVDQRVSTYFNDKIRHDYDPRRCVLVIRMPSSVHDVFQASLLSKITDFSIKLHSAEAAEAKKQKYTHSPDGQYHFPGFRYPVFVVEIGFSQTGQDLEELAKHYYEDTDGHIKTVLTVDLGRWAEYALHITAQELFNMLARTGVVQGDRDKTNTPSPTPQAQPQKRRVEWVLQQEEDDENDQQDEEEQDGTSPSRKTPTEIIYHTQRYCAPWVQNVASRPIPDNAESTGSSSTPTMGQWYNSLMQMLERCDKMPLSKGRKPGFHGFQCYCILADAFIRVAEIKDIEPGCSLKLSLALILVPSWRRWASAGRGNPHLPATAALLAAHLMLPGLPESSPR
ncbi:hypothetical protein DHEL01_v208208 [Diaporthe helianthi]|uniref:Uncharacterized protein n=1 Tax=Diaporthe helianthi TaxID=158607 RepID=A0A2P5HT08_DIAHE|nr:hypothetical protein DHEL01_v208208 [Diaporthe helianthi]